MSGTEMNEAYWTARHNAFGSHLEKERGRHAWGCLTGGCLVGVLGCIELAVANFALVSDNPMVDKAALAGGLMFGLLMLKTMYHGWMSHRGPTAWARSFRG